MKKEHTSRRLTAKRAAALALSAALLAAGATGAATLNDHHKDNITDGTGGGYEYSAQALTYTDVTEVKNNSAKSSATDVHGGALYSEVTVSITSAAASDLEISGNTVSTTAAAQLKNVEGGAIRGYKGVTLTGRNNIIVKNNSATSEMGGASGGALSGAELAPVVVTADGSIIFDTNTVMARAGEAAGGGIATQGVITVTAGDAITMKNNTAESNNRTVGVAGGGALSTVLAINVKAGGDILFESNAARGTSYAAGGAVSSTVDVDILGASITAISNVARSNGGYRNTASPDIPNASGGAFASASGNVNLTATNGAITLQKNAATADSTKNLGVGSGHFAQGGAVWAMSGDVTLSGKEITLADNTASATNGSQDGGEAEGGAIWAAGDVVLKDADSITLTNNVASSDISSASGGAIYSDEGDVEVNAAKIEFTGNKALAPAAEAYGGAVEANNIVMNGTTSISLKDNVATGMFEVRGGAILAWESATLSGGAIELSGNSVDALTDENGYSEARGGAVFAETVTLKDGAITLSGNKARVESGAWYGVATGGAIFAGEAHLNAGTEKILIANNTAENYSAYDNDWEMEPLGADGGAIFAGDVTVEGGEITFEKNVTTHQFAEGGAGASGGGIKVLAGDGADESGGAKLAGTTITFKENGAVATSSMFSMADGGGISAPMTVLSAEKVLFDGNYATATAMGTEQSSWVMAQAAGGGIGINYGSATISGTSDVTFKNNRAEATATGSSGNDQQSVVAQAMGGAIYASTVTIEGGAVTFETNRATAKADNGMVFGGALFASGGDMYATSSTGGDGAEAQSVTVSLTGSLITFTGNSATGTGTGVLAAGGGIFSIGSVELTAEDDGAIEFSKNIASGTAAAGGGLFAADAKLKAKTITFNGNSVASTAEVGADARGGAIFALNTVDLTADRVEFLTESDTVFVGGLEKYSSMFENSEFAIDLAGTGDLNVKGTLYVAPKASLIGMKSVTVKGGLELDGAEASNKTKLSELDLPAFAGKTVNFGGAELSVLNLPAADGPGEYSVDLAVAATADADSLTTPGLSNFRPGAEIILTPGIALDEGQFAMLTEEELAAFTAIQKMSLKYSVASLTWNGGDGTWGVGQGGWKDGDKDEKFYAGDFVKFGDKDNNATVTVKGSVVAGGMTVEGGSRTITGADGDASLTVNTLEMKSGELSLGMQVTANDATFTAGTLRVDGNIAKDNAVLLSNGGTLKIEENASLYIYNANADPDGVTYFITSGFKTVTGSWEGRVDSDAAGDDITYEYTLDGGAISVTIFCAEPAVAGVDVIWRGADGDAWAVMDRKKLWIEKADSAKVDFDAGTKVTFDDKATGGVVLTGDLKPKTMTITGGEHTFTGDGTLTVEQELLIKDGTNTFSNAGALKTAAMTLSGGKNTFSGDGDTTVTGALNASGGTNTFSGAGKLTAGSATLSGGTNTFNGDVTVNGALTLAEGTNTFGDAGALKAKTITAAGGKNTFNGDVTATGALNASGGTNTFGDKGSLTAGSAKLSGGTNTFKGDVTVTDELEISGGTNTFSGGVTADQLSIMKESTNTFSGAGDVTVATTTISDGENTFSGEGALTADTLVASGGKNTFSGAGGLTVNEKMTLSGGTNVFSGGDVTAGTLAIENGDNTFSGDGAADLTTLNVTGGATEFAREVTAQSATLSGADAKLTLSSPLTVSKSFTQSGGTLYVDAAKSEVLLGGGTATLKIEGGAKLYLEGAAIGETYTIASGFAALDGVWANSNVGGSDENGADLYATFTVSPDVEVAGDNRVLIVVTEVEKIPFIIPAGPALTLAARTGNALQNHGVGVMHAPAAPDRLALGFMPMNPGKKGGVWASAWYSHARIDNDTADMKFKNYGVTIGADRMLKNGAVVGMAVDLGKSEGRGKGDYEGSDSDGKHIGVNLYAARDVARGAVTLAGDLGYTWHRDDYDSVAGSNYFRARKAKSGVFSVGGTAFWNLRGNGRVSVKPFLGVRWSRFDMDDFTVEKNGSAWATLSGERVSQWTVPLGVKFDWSPMTTKKGWKVKPAAEIAYVWAGGDRDLNLRQATVSGSGATTSRQLLTDRNNFRASLGLEAKRKDFTLGLGVNALLSSGQKDVAVNATLRWDL